MLAPSPALWLPPADLTLHCQPLLLVHRLLPSARCHRRHRGLLVQPAVDSASPDEHDRLGLKISACGASGGGHGALRGVAMAIDLSTGRDTYYDLRGGDRGQGGQKWTFFFYCINR